MMKSLEAGSFSHLSPHLDGKLAGYLAATGALGAAVLAQDAQAAVVANTAVQPFGINGTVNIDFNSDSQADFQIDHDRVNLSGTDLDYLQLDKNDINGEADPIPIDSFAVFPENGQPRNNDHKYLTDGGDLGIDLGEYVDALDAGTMIGPASTGVWEFQEGDNFLGGGTVRRANRIIDEDAGQIDTALPPETPTASPPPGTARFVGLNGTTKYVGVAIDLQDAGYPGNDFPSVNGPNFADNPLNYWYGWIGIRITNEADATGEVVGYAYENQLGVAIAAGDVGTPMGLPGDYNGDHTVDAADYTVWQDHLGLTGGATSMQGDGNGDGNVTPEDYGVWKTNFGMSSPGSASAAGLAVPEPSSIALAAFGGIVVLGAFVARKLLGSEKK